MCFSPPSAPAGRATDRQWCFPKGRVGPCTLTVHTSPQLAHSPPGGRDVTQTGKPSPLHPGLPWGPSAALWLRSHCRRCWGWEPPSSLALWRTLPKCNNKQPFQRSLGPCCGRDTARGSSLTGDWVPKDWPPGLGGGNRRQESGVKGTPVPSMKTEAGDHFARTSVCSYRDCYVCAL